MTKMTPTSADHTRLAPLRPTCQMPYHPSPGVNLIEHDQNAGRKFYVVTRGRIVGAHTDPEVARNQVTGFGDGFQKSFDHFEDARTFWAGVCDTTHGIICDKADPAEVAAAASTMLDRAFPAGPTPVTPVAAAPASSPVPSQFAAHPYSQGAPAAGVRAPVTMATRIQLSPTKPGKFWGCAGIERLFDSRGEALAAAFGKGIEKPHVWGHANKTVVEDFPLKRRTSGDLATTEAMNAAVECRGGPERAILEPAGNLGAAIFKGGGVRKLTRKGGVTRYNYGRGRDATLQRKILPPTSMSQPTASENTSASQTLASMAPALPDLPSVVQTVAPDLSIEHGLSWPPPAPPAAQPQPMAPSAVPSDGPSRGGRKKCLQPDAPKVKAKPGNKGDFHGSRLAFLRKNLDEYLAASKAHQTRKFWPKLFEEYWALFDWRLALNEEPMALGEGKRSPR
ncbi:hypothetical protein C8R43DRAFT_960995 [Mycena crocata]|nr:hypothetical protein C8R43DRAFT_960995 [Mycena crocata]